MAQKPLHRHDEGGRAPILASRIPPRDLRRLDRLAEARGMRRSELVRAAVEALLDREEDLLTA